MNVDLNKQDLINLVKSTTPSMSECDNYTKQGLMTFTGNQWNEDWSWVTSEISKLTEKEIYTLYLKHR